MHAWYDNDIVINIPLRIWNGSNGREKAWLIHMVVHPELRLLLGAEGCHTHSDSSGGDVERVGKLFHKLQLFIKVGLVYRAGGIQKEKYVSRVCSTVWNCKSIVKIPTVSKQTGPLLCL